jgi:hypothetical protein
MRFVFSFTGEIAYVVKMYLCLIKETIRVHVLDLGPKRKTLVPKDLKADTAS